MSLSSPSMCEANVGEKRRPDSYYLGLSFHKNSRKLGMGFKSKFHPITSQCIDEYQQNLSAAEKLTY